MKKLSLLFLAVVGLMSNSCEDAYNIVQDGEFNESATFKTLDDMKLFLNEVYDQQSNLNQIGASAAITDEASLGYQNAGQDRDVYGFIINSNDAFADGIWSGQYLAINYTNRLIRGAAQITPTAAELPEYNSILAQARVLRAFGHFQLLTSFSPDMKDDSSLGCIIMDRVPELMDRPARNTTGEVFAFIEEDLNFAYANLIDYTTATAPNTKPWTYFTKTAIDAFRARMYAYRGNYPLALQYANQVIAAGPALAASTPVPAPTTVAPNFGAVGTGTGNPATTTATAWATSGWNGAFYGTATTNPYRRMWQDLAQGEIIFSLERSVGKEGVAGLFYFNRTNFGGGPFHEMDRNLFNLLEQNNGPNMSNDIRRYAFVDATSKVDQPGYPNFSYSAPDDYTVDSNYRANDVLLIDKYPGKAGFDLGNDLKIFRMSEMYFIRAEALIAAGNLTDAATAVHAVRLARNFRGTPPALPVYANATAAWADVLLERRLELCYEGHRYIDLKRLGTLANTGLDRYVRECELVNTCSIPTTDYRFTLPIPIAERNANPNAQQNPGYDD